MSRQRHKLPHGQIRSSQLINTFGPGAPLDLPKHSVLVGGLDDWSPGGRPIHEPRLVEKLTRLLEMENPVQLFSPPPDNQDPTAPPSGIRAWQFPEWFITQSVEERPGSNVRSRRLVHRKSLSKGKFRGDDRKRQPVVPVRFVKACRRGHISDIDWRAFIHRGTGCTRLELWMDELGTSGDISEIWVRCSCGMKRPLSDATVWKARQLGICDGQRPWLGPFNREECAEPSRLLIRTASNAYFPQKLTVIALPERDEALQDAVNQVWEHYLQYVDSLEDLQQDRQRKPPVQNALDGFDDEDVYEVIRRRRQGRPREDRPIKQAELETLLSSQKEIGQDRPDGDFYARTLARADWEAPLTQSLERVVLVHRLREVVAQVGFTRFEPSTPDLEGELELGVQPAALAQEVSWLPAVENRGEGIFLSIQKPAIEQWLRRPFVIERGRKLLAGFQRWESEHPGTNRKFFGLPYIMLHSLSHLLITAVSLDCGYPASSIRERIYAGDSGYGILLYTGTPDAEGTLGGLVEIGRHLPRYLEAATELGKLCSNDPVCAQHNPSDTFEQRYLAGAACHGCLLIAEPSCEQRNDFLDRALVVETVDSLGAEFFAEQRA